MYALIGNPLGHSFSADFFNEKFEKENIDDKYELCPLSSVSEVTKFINSHPDLKGFNVTIPYKKQIMPLIDFLSDEAKEIGAVNVVKIVKSNGKIILKGYNTDAIGFKNSILPLIKPEMNRALVLGTGGASHAISYVLRSLNIQVTKVSRHESPGVLTYVSLNKDIIDDNKIIVNTTPLGTWPKTEGCPDIPFEHITQSHLCFDLVYNPGVTTFMKKAMAHGATVKNGLEMLHLQALAAWQIWNNP